MNSRFGRLLCVDLVFLVLFSPLAVGGIVPGLPGPLVGLLALLGLGLAPWCFGGVPWAYVARAGVGFSIAAALAGEGHGLATGFGWLLVPVIAEQAVVAVACLAALFLRPIRLP